MAVDPSTGRPAGLGARGPLKILIVDDSPSIRRRLAERLLEVVGVEIVGEAGNAGQALESIRRTRPDLLTLDLRMPEGDGLSLLEELGRRESSPWVAVVTNHVSPEYRVRCLALGAVALLDKSTQIDELVELIERLRQRPRSELGP